MRNIIITGATGFAGSHILDAFKESTTKDYNIIAAGRNRSKLANFYSGESLIGDLLDKEYIERLTTKADVICHSAAWAEMNGTDEDSKKYFYEPTINLIDSALKNGVKRFIFLSAVTSNPIEKNTIHSKKALHKIWPHYDSIMKIEKYLKKASEQGIEAVILRTGYFTGKNYALGLLPILLPRLKTHLVPWVKGGKTSLPLINGKDVGSAFKLASLAELNDNFYKIDIVGKEVPTTREVFNYLHKKYKYPLPHFGVSFKFAYAFAKFMQVLYKIIPGDPLIVPSIVLLLEESNANNNKAAEILNYHPTVNWQESIDIQITEMSQKQTLNMKMNKSK